MAIRILLVEDDEHICNVLKAFMLEAGYMVDACFDGLEAQEKFYESSYQLIILDIMLPGSDGHDLLKEFRKHSDAPVLIMTALSDDLNQILAFESEADDYVTKPFKMQILLKRVEALLRRSGALSKETRCGKLTLLNEEFRAYYEGAELVSGMKPTDFPTFSDLYALLQKRLESAEDRKTSNISR